MTALRRPRHPEDCAMEDTLLYPRELIAARVVFTPADHAQIALCRGAHNRLGFRAWGLVEREALSHFLREEALHLDHLAALVAQAEAFLRDHQILLPALSTLR